ncbi:glycoside hydrolase family 125 protein [Puteibacter caeruleilacunae]|nr:glycoside hydrolase family 125 protein [Puteibacter caeruleilacunae]
MKNRRDFIKISGATALGIMAAPGFAGNAFAGNFSSNRPTLTKRNFVSDAVEAKIKEMKGVMGDKELAWMFENCFPNTLDTTVKFAEKNGRPDTFVITGDIEAMWLRDSTAQVWPYLPLIKEDAKLKKCVAGLINRQTDCVLIDPYANAFNFGPSGSHWESDITDMKPELHERKWEIDSLCYSVRLAYHYWKTTGDASPFDSKWLEAQKAILKTFKEQQRKSDRGPYSFMRNTAIATDTCPGRGWGNPINPVGLICSAFRPSDDATVFLFLVPSNYFAVVSLRQMAEMVKTLKGEKKLAEDCKALANEVEAALEKYAIHDHPKYGKIIAFEVDGFGNRLFMDDSNIPSLLSLPYLGAMDVNDPLYQRTRKFVLSEDNPYFFKGKYAEGVGGPHVGMDYIWPMSITMRCMTSTDKKEIREGLRMLKNTHGGTGFMHEGVHKDDPKNFTRDWFAWANTLFGEMILKVYHEHPELITSKL